MRKFRPEYNLANPKSDVLYEYHRIAFKRA